MVGTVHHSEAGGPIQDTQRSCDREAARTSRSSSIAFIEEKQISPVFQS